MTPLDLYTDSNSRQRSTNCVADDVTSMELQYTVTDQLALQRYATEQVLAFTGPGDTTGGRPDWAVLGIIAVHHHAMYTGDLDLAKAQFAHLLAVHSCLQKISATSGLYEGIDALVDNGPRDGFVTSHTSTVASAWVYYGAVRLAELAQLIGRSDDATRLAAQAAALKVAMNKLQWRGSSLTPAFCDGLCSNASTRHAAFHSTVHPLAFGAVDADHVLAAWQYVQQTIDPIGGMPCGPYPAQFAVRALYENERDGGAAALALLTNGTSGSNSWAAMLQRGATMTMEMWSEDMWNGVGQPRRKTPNFDWSHPWAASPAYLIPWFLFGVRPTSPGFATVSIRPQPGGLANGNLTMPTVRGPIQVGFAQESAKRRTFALSIALPAGCLASVGIPLFIPQGSPVPTSKNIVADGATVVAAISPGGGFAVIENVGPGGKHSFILPRTATVPDPM